ncbi:TetR/AcrR family transcriptional regulator [Paenibacillus sp. Soil522]|uniref:TetR/AcrR family transcriptional regulator n=1 Tax=Paenibacillus sp. Soil522 TaxID=1736388 RepID=UPI0006F37555|nr:TetR/AcrR family transcriptional regulator [Paenibacillus sp. Soil522]KRE35147.1 hypothetical protein ASG81_21415 [Paenibacillus sp. Soil522]
MPKIVATELDWVKLGLQIFAEGGVDALVVEQLAKQLGSSKTSFYWYFKNRSLFVNRIIDYWHEQTTVSIITHIQQHQAAEPKQKVRQLLSVMFSSNEGKDFIYHLRKLGTAESTYAELLIQIEQQRLDYMSGLLMHCGLIAEDARSASGLIYNYYLGWYERNKYSALSIQEAEKQADQLMSFIRINHVP